MQKLVEYVTADEDNITPPPPTCSQRADDVMGDENIWDTGTGKWKVKG